MLLDDNVQSLIVSQMAEVKHITYGLLIFRFDGDFKVRPKMIL
jgi:hypothetical protein